jgi:hypothetical protein
VRDIKFTSSIWYYYIFSTKLCHSESFIARTEFRSYTWNPWVFPSLTQIAQRQIDKFSSRYLMISHHSCGDGICKFIQWLIAWITETNTVHILMDICAMRRLWLPTMSETIFIAIQQMFSFYTIKEMFGVSENVYIFSFWRNLDDPGLCRSIIFIGILTHRWTT